LIFLSREITLSYLQLIPTRFCDNRKKILRSI